MERNRRGKGEKERLNQICVGKSELRPMVGERRWWHRRVKTQIVWERGRKTGKERQFIWSGCQHRDGTFHVVFCAGALSSFSLHAWMHAHLSDLADAQLGTGQVCHHGFRVPAWSGSKSQSLQKSRAAAQTRYEHVALQYFTKFHTSAITETLRGVRRFNVNATRNFTVAESYQVTRFVLTHGNVR